MDDTELIKFAEEFRDGLLGGRSSHLMCHVVSYPLSGLLNASGVECEIAVGDIGSAITSGSSSRMDAFLTQLLTNSRSTTGVRPARYI